MYLLTWAYVGARVGVFPAKRKSCNSSYESDVLDDTGNNYHTYTNECKENLCAHAIIHMYIDSELMMKVHVNFMLGLIL